MNKYTLLVSLILFAAIGVILHQKQLKKEGFTDIDPGVIAIVAILGTIFLLSIFGSIIMAFKGIR